MINGLGLPKLTALLAPREGKRIVIPDAAFSSGVKKECHERKIVVSGHGSDIYFFTRVVALKDVVRGSLVMLRP